MLAAGYQEMAAPVRPGTAISSSEGERLWLARFQQYRNEVAACGISGLRIKLSLQGANIWLMAINLVCQGTGVRRIHAVDGRGVAT